MNPVEQYILRQREPHQSLMLYVRSLIKRTLPEVEEQYKYAVPFYYYNKRPILYLNILKGTDFTDVAFVHGALLQKKYPELKDYNKRKNVRSLQVKRLEDFDALAFEAILKEASSLV